MSKPVTRSYTSMDSGAQAPVPLDWLSLAQMTVGVYIVDGTADYSVEFTLDDVNDPDITPRWFTSQEFPVNTMATKYAGIANPWTFLRINFASIAGNVELKVQQVFMNGSR